MEKQEPYQHVVCLRDLLFSKSARNTNMCSADLPFPPKSPKLHHERWHAFLPSSSSLKREVDDRMFCRSCLPTLNFKIPTYVWLWFPVLFSKIKSTSRHVSQTLPPPSTLKTQQSHDMSSALLFKNRIG